jgi:hypothetical protein
MKIFLILLVVLGKASSCSYFSLFDYRYATTKDEYQYNYTAIKVENTRLPEEAKEEAIVLIGGSNFSYLESLYKEKTD